jgi:hypothetical protein
MKEWCVLHSNLEFTSLSTQCPPEYIHKSYIPQALDTHNINLETTNTQWIREPSPAYTGQNTRNTKTTENLVPTEDRVKSNKAVAERAHEEQ